MVELSARDPKIEGSNPAAVAGRGKTGETKHFPRGDLASEVIVKAWQRIVVMKVSLPYYLFVNMVLAAITNIYFRRADSVLGKGDYRRSDLIRKR